MLTSQIGMINETVKCIRNYHYHCTWCTENFCGILCGIFRLYIQEIHSCWWKYSKWLPGKWRDLVFSPLLLMSHFWNTCECWRRTGTSELLHPWLYTWKCGRRRKEDLWLQPWGGILGSCSAELIPLWCWQPGGTTLLSVYLPSPDLCKATSDNPGLTYDPTLMFT